MDQSIASTNNLQFPSKPRYSGAQKVYRDLPLARREVEGELFPLVDFFFKSRARDSARTRYGVADND